MATVQVTFYEQFTKQPNSTLRPTEASPSPLSRSFDCTLWEGVSLMAPVIELALKSGSGTFDNPAQLGMTYCYIPSFRRFYWVLDWELIDSLWVATLQVDVLASYKTEIGNTSIFADRLGDRLGPGYPILTPLVPVDTGLPDNMIPTLSRPYVCHEAVTINWLKQGLNQGVYVLGVINADNDSVGAVSYYAMTQSQFRHFMAIMLSGTYLGSGLDVSQETAKAILNPFQYVATCNWFPLTVQDVTGASNPTPRTGLSLGWWSMQGVNYYNIVPNGIVKKCFTFKLQPHPYAGPLNLSMLNFPPYTEYKMQLPYFGSCVMTRLEYQSGNVTCLCTFDLISGLAQCRIYDKFPLDYNYERDGHFPSDTAMDTIITRCNLVRTLSAQASTPIQVGQTTSDYGAARVSQIVASSTATSNSAMLGRAYASAMSQSVLSAAGAAVNLVSGNFRGVAGSLIGAVSAYNEAQITQRYQGAAVAAQNRAARASGAYTSAVQKAPKVETSGNNGSVMESIFPAELTSEYLIPSTITNHQFDANYNANGDITDTVNLLQWVGYAHGQCIQINEHTGFIQGHDPQFNSYFALAPEIDQIKQFMSDGFFYQ